MEHFWLSIAEQFTQNGNRAYLAYPEITRLSPAISKAPIDTIELTIPWTNREQATATKRFIRENNISFIYLTDQPFFNHQYAIFRALGVEHIIVHDHTPGDRPPVTGLKGLLKSTRNTLPWLTADSVLCVSEHMRQRNMANARIPEKKCQVVQNGIPPLNCTQATTPALRESIGADQNSILVTTTGRAHPYKRFDFIINVAHELKKLAADIDVFFLLAGDGPAMPELQQQINRLQLQQSVHLLGYRSDITDILCASDIALHAALGEGFSLSIIEYMSAGLPVLVPDIPSVSQAINHNKTGLIYAHDKAQSAAACIEELARNKSRRLAMGDAAKEKADSTYTLEQCTKNLLQAIDRTLTQ